jgi:two-component system cell cycle sensor histidine kinase/response regulator CckA
VSPTKIMVVEDEFIVAKDLKAHLEKLGYQVTSLRATGEEAVKAVGAEQPDLILMDVVLAGGMDGVQAAEAIRGQMDIPVIFLTAYSDQETTERAKTTGPYAYLLKPFERRELGVTIELALYKARMEAELKQSEERYRTLVENTHEGILVIQEGSTKFFNNQMLELSGYSASELSAMPLLDLVHPADRDTVDACLTGWDQVEPPDIAISFRAITAGGQERWMEANQARIDWQGKPALLIFMCDVTERRQLEAQSLRNQKMESLGVVAGGVAHDYNNILMGILGSCELALEGISRDSSAHAELERIQELAGRAVDLTKRMLEFTGKAWHPAREIDLNQVVRQGETLAKAALPQGARLVLELERGLPKVQGDAIQLQQVLLSLVSNAAEALEETSSGRVGVRTQIVHCDQAFLQSTYFYEDQAPGRYVMLEVSDNGSGIAKDDRDRLFDPFFTTKFLGRGLGLAAVMGIVRAMKGAIRLSSEAGQGSSFCLYLPATRDEPA